MLSNKKIDTKSGGQTLRLLVVQNSCGGWKIDYAQSPDGLANQSVYPVSFSMPNKFDLRLLKSARASALLCWCDAFMMIACTYSKKWTGVSKIHYDVLLSRKAMARLSTLRTGGNQRAKKWNQVKCTGKVWHQNGTTPAPCFRRPSAILSHKRNGWHIHGYDSVSWLICGDWLYNLIFTYSTDLWQFLRIEWWVDAVL